MPSFPVVYVVKYYGTKFTLGIIGAAVQPLLLKASEPCLHVLSHKKMLPVINSEAKISMFF